jgi:hypothetical protein
MIGAGATETRPMGAKRTTARPRHWGDGGALSFLASLASRTRRSLGWAALGAAWTSAACGAARPSPAAVATVEVPPPPPPAAPAPVMVMAERASAAVAAAPSVVSPVADESRRKTGRDLDEAERELQSSAGDCVTACRALGSMERATAHLCALASVPSDLRACEDAKSKVLAGRDRVRTSCGDCPNGPSLDRNAPIPSTR